MPGASQHNDKLRDLVDRLSTLASRAEGPAAELLRSYMALGSRELGWAASAALTWAVVESSAGPDLLSASGGPAPYLRWPELAGISAEVKEAINVDPDSLSELHKAAAPRGARRLFGEYYTPLWLASWVAQRVPLKEGLVLDPFCGAGSFLAASLKAKVLAGEEPDEAINEVMGLDSSPLAASLARVALTVGYRDLASRLPSRPPPVYVVDTFGEAYGGGTPWTAADPLGALALVRRAAEGRAKEVEGSRPAEVVLGLRELEAAIDAGLRRGELKGPLEGRLGPLEGVAVEVVRRAGDQLAALARRYGPRGWAMMVASAVASALVPRALRPEVILTNPPWVQLTSYRAPWAGSLRGALRNLIASAIADRGRAAAVLMGTDLSVAALRLSLIWAAESVGIVMPETQALWPESPQRSGVLATYSVIRASEGWGFDMIRVNIDVFGHGVRPTLVIARRGGAGVRAWQLARDLSLKPLEVSYETYVSGAIAWALRGHDDLARDLGVELVRTMGGYVRGVRGGDRRLEGRYAGLELKLYEDLGEVARLRLANTSAPVTVPRALMERHGAGRYGLLYHTLVRPFSCGAASVLLAESEGRLRDLLLELAELMPESDARLVRALAAEVRAKLDLLRPGGLYVVYRGKSAFAACPLTPAEELATYSNVGYLKCISEAQQAYYAGALNYLAYKVVEQGRRFLRDQYGRPLAALVEAGLAWPSLSEEVRKEAAELSRRAANEAKELKDSLRAADAVRALGELGGFRELVELLDSVSGSGLQRALALVSY